MSSSRPDPAVLVAPIGFAAAVAVLVVAGRGELAAPPIDGLGEWLEARGAITAAMAFVRLGALVAAVWALVVVTVAAIAQLAGATRLAMAAQRAVPPGVRRALAALVGAGVVGTAIVGAHRGSSLGAAAPAGVAVDAFAAAGHADGPAGAGGGGTEPTVTMSVLPAEAPPPMPSPPMPSPPPAPAPTWTVAPGDSFWSIAEEVVADGLGRPPSDAEIVPYWWRLIEANRAQLVSGDPDLILPGQVFTIPGP